MHNMVRLELHQLAFADFAWQGRNTHFFNRLFLVLAGEGEVRNHTGGERLALRPGFGVFLPEGLDLGFEFRPGLRFLSCHFNLSVLPGVDLFGQERHCREFPVDPGRWSGSSGTSLRRRSGGPSARPKRFSGA